MITPNFDQLLETAIRDEGVTPTVISTPDLIAGMMPLHLERITITKVHGDYLDTRIRNTPDELRGYDDATNALLDRVFDDYGLVVCGWSATWGRGTSCGDSPRRRAASRCFGPAPDHHGRYDAHLRSRRTRSCVVLGYQ